MRMLGDKDNGSFWVKEEKFTELLKNGTGKMSSTMTTGINWNASRWKKMRLRFYFFQLEPTTCLIVYHPNSYVEVLTLRTSESDFLELESLQM